jgi:hypothetical protein
VFVFEPSEPSFVVQFGRDGIKALPCKTGLQASEELIRTDLEAASKNESSFESTCELRDRNESIRDSAKYSKLPLF